MSGKAENPLPHDVVRSKLDQDAQPEDAETERRLSLPDYISFRDTFMETEVYLWIRETFPYLEPERIVDALEQAFQVGNNKWNEYQYPPMSDAINNIQLPLPPRETSLIENIPEEVFSTSNSEVIRSETTQDEANTELGLIEIDLDPVQTIEDWNENKEEHDRAHTVLFLRDIGFSGEGAQEVSERLFDSVNESWNSMTHDVEIPRKFRDETPEE